MPRAIDAVCDVGHRTGDSCSATPGVSVADGMIRHVRPNPVATWSRPNDVSRYTRRARHRPTGEAMKHIKWNDIPYEKLNEKFLRKIAWDGKVMIALTEVAQGYQVPLHSHDNEQVSWVMSGIWRFRLEGRTVDVGPGEMIFIPANVEHSAEAIESLVAYDIFTPPRQDWLTGTDSYLRDK
jgi:quercetin dioxygenase-like cupin family protein